MGYAEVGAETYSTDLNYNGQDGVGVGRAAAEQRQCAGSGSAGQGGTGRTGQVVPARARLPGSISTPRRLSATPFAKWWGRWAKRSSSSSVVIFLFLLDWRATIIPAITIPVSLIGTFAFIKIFDFSINSLTMFGITLATGLVVDDAIVVIENVQRHINEDHSDPHTATSVAMAEVTSAVIATSLVLISVFVPVSFFPGTTGILYKQFSLTIAFSIAISAFNALTLVTGAGRDSAARGEAQARPCWDGSTAASVAGTVFYGKAIRGVLRLRYVVLLVFFCGLAATVYLYNTVPSAFLPTEDQNYLLCIVQTPPGASLTYTSNVAENAVKLIRQNKDVYGNVCHHGFQPQRR